MKYGIYKALKEHAKSLDFLQEECKGIHEKIMCQTEKNAEFESNNIIHAKQVARLQKQITELQQKVDTHYNAFLLLREEVEHISYNLQKEQEKIELYTRNEITGLRARIVYAEHKSPTLWQVLKATCKKKG